MNGVLCGPNVTYTSWYRSGLRAVLDYCVDKYGQAWTPRVYVEYCSKLLNNPCDRAKEFGKSSIMEMRCDTRIVKRRGIALLLQDTTQHREQRRLVSYRMWYWYDKDPEELISKKVDSILSDPILTEVALASVPPSLRSCPPFA